MTSKETVQELVLIQAHTDHEKGLHIYAFLKIHNHATEEDLVQETFMKTWVYLAKGGIIDSMKPFLYHILNNLIIDEYRKKKTVSLDRLLDKGFAPHSDTHAQECDTIDLASLLEQIKLLPEGYKHVLHMHYIEHRSLAEMMTITGHSKNALSVQLFRGLDKLKNLNPLN